MEEEFDLENAKSFFDSDEEEQDDESISLSPDELGNITAEDFELDSSSSENFSSDEANFDLTEETEDLEIESKSDLFDENATEDEEIALSGDELNNLIESGEIETEEEQENEVVEADDSSAHSFLKMPQRKMNPLLYLRMNLEILRQKKTLKFKRLMELTN